MELTLDDSMLHFNSGNIVQIYCFFSNQLNTISEVGCNSAITGGVCHYVRRCVITITDNIMIFKLKEEIN